MQSAGEIVFLGHICNSYRWKNHHIYNQCSSQATPLRHLCIFSCFGAEKISSCAIQAQKIYYSIGCKCVVIRCFYLRFTINRHRNYFKMQRKL